MLLIKNNFIENYIKLIIISSRNWKWFSVYVVKYYTEKYLLLLTINNKLYST